MKCRKCNSKLIESVNIYTGSKIELIKSISGSWFISGKFAMRCTDEFRELNKSVEYFDEHKCKEIQENLFRRKT